MVNRTAQCLGIETRTATARVGGVRIVETEAAVVKSLDPVDLHAQQVESVGLIHEHGYVADRKALIVFLLLIEAEDVREPTASSALDAYPKCIGGRDLLLLTNAIQLCLCSRSD